jgi:DNA-binding GntR family transcriptional regulator
LNTSMPGVPLLAFWTGPVAPGAIDTLSLVPAHTARPGGRLGSLVYGQLKEKLLDGHYMAGDRVAVEELKAEFGVSKQPVMDALRRLNSDGLVEILPQIGCRIPVYGRRETADYFNTFASFEGVVAAIAATRWVGDQVDELSALNTRIRNDGAISPGERTHRYRVGNRQFHSLIHTMADSRVIADVSRRMFDLADLLINTAGRPFPLADAIPARADDHDAICAALRQRDADGARAAMELHIRSTATLIFSREPPEPVA